jgi:hypothetical protein
LGGGYWGWGDFGRCANSGRGDLELVRVVQHQLQRLRSEKQATTSIIETCIAKEATRTIDIAQIEVRKRR